MHTMRKWTTRWLRALVALAVMLPASVAAASASCPMHQVDHSKTVVSQSCCCQPHQTGGGSCESACSSSSSESSSIPALSSPAPVQVVLLLEAGPVRLVAEAAPSFRPAAFAAERPPATKRYLLSCALRQ